LVHKCPTWTWESAEEGKAVSYLPKNKQFLLTRNVPCLMRLKAFEGQVNASTTETVADNDGDWCAPTFAAPGATGDSAVSGVSGASAASSSSSGGGNASAASTGKHDTNDDDDDDIPDMETFEDENIGEADDSAAISATAAATTASRPAAASVAAPAVNDNIVRTRTYDISMSYDKYYQTPKIWLFGYDEARQPLKAEQMFEDISADHAQKTVTIETHPALSSSWAFIHPCRHAAVMKRIIERQLANNTTPRADQYLFLFLKFINAVIPTIEYDATIEMTA
jgi:ubiquitin-like-conjugating enzyme ATG3